MKPGDLARILPSYWSKKYGHNNKKVINFGIEVSDGDEIYFNLPLDDRQNEYIYLFPKEENNMWISLE